MLVVRRERQCGVRDSLPWVIRRWLGLPARELIVPAAEYPNVKCLNVRFSPQHRSVFTEKYGIPFAGLQPRENGGR
jgi:hypothetical protein